MIHLESITPENWRLGLKVAKEQEEFVSNSTGILARAFAYRNERSEAFVIYLDETPIGMAMYYDCDELQAYNFSQFFIDEKYQRRGFGVQAAQKVLALMKNDGKYSRVILCYFENNTAAKQLYEKLGFRHTGEQDGDEIIMQKEL